MTSPAPPTNWSGNVDLSGARGMVEPGSVEEVRRFLADTPSDTPVRVIGRTGSASPLLATSGWLMSLSRLARICPADRSTLRAGVDAATLVDIEAGVTIQALCAWLDRRGLALPMTTAFTSLTYVGAAATGSHGAGVGHPPMCDQVVGVELVKADGDVLWIEGAAGPTDPAAFACLRLDATLVRDDELLDAIGVGLGAFGVITRVRVRVVRGLHLEQLRARVPWREARELLADVDEHGVPRVEHGAWGFGIPLNPYAIAGRQRTAVLKRTVRSPHPIRPMGALAVGAGRRLSPTLVRALETVGTRLPRSIPLFIEAALRGPRAHPRRHGAAHHINGVASLPKGYSVELAFPVEAALDGLDGLLELLAAARSRGDMVDAWLAVRFVGRSRAWLAMTHGGPRCCVEVLTTAGNRHLGTLLDEVLAFGLALDARPHWGQVLPAQPGPLARLYPRFDDWHQQVRRLDPFGRFSNDLLRELEAHRHG